MRTYFILYLAALITIAILDGAWLTIMGKRFYAQYIGHLMAQSPQWVPVVLFYLIYIIGVTVLVTMPAIYSGVSIGKVFMLGALLGLAAYGAYDFTNHATLRDWPTVVTVVDLLWGMVVTGMTSAVAVVITRAIG